MRFGRVQRPCFVHVGTHKTGTTAIQGLLLNSAALLARHGICYPRSGLFLAGQHNLVFELMRDERFSASSGTWSDLCDELAGSDAERVCLSSEAFEYLYDRPADLVYVRDTIRALGFTPVIVLYVRPQAQYAASLFAELAKHRHTGSFDDFVDEVCRTGAFRSNVYGCTETFGFAYDAIASGFARVFRHAAVVVRRYSTMPGAVVDDFLDLLGGAALRRDVAPATKSGLVNTRDDLFTVVQRYADNDARYAGSSDRARALLDCLRLEPTMSDCAFNPLMPRHVVKLVTHFAAENARLARTWGVSIPVASANEVRNSLVAALDPRPRAAVVRRALRSLSMVPAPRAGATVMRHARPSGVR